MARPNKVGLEYFSLDVSFDDEVQLIKAQYGMEGIGILITMYQTIYADKGYYREWNERNQILFSNKVSVNRNEVVTVINDCIKWDIFSKKMYETYNILTSRRIQKQYIKATYKRKEVEIVENYLLIKKDDRENITYIKVSDVNNQDTTSVSDSKSTQSNKDKYKDKESINTSCSDSKTDSEPEEPEPKFDEESIPYKAALHLRNLIANNFPRQPVPDKTPKDLEDWAIELDRLNRLGPVGAKEHEGKGYTWQEIRDIMDWCQDDSFWKSNILSASKFREQIVKLEGKMKSNNAGDPDGMNQTRELYQEFLEEEEAEQGVIDI